MQTFTEAMAYLETQISDLSSSQIHSLTRKIVDDFLQKLPKDWEKTELEAEQPIYLKLADLLKKTTWDFDEIEQHLQALDEIAENMEDYPADTDFLPMTLSTMSAILSQLIGNEQDDDDLQDIFFDLVEEYLNIADYFANETSPINEKKWFNYPIIKQAFDQIMAWINDVKIK